MRDFGALRLGSDFGRTDFSRIFVLGPPDFFADLDETRELGRHQLPGPENQDDQHMLNQPRGLSLILEPLFVDPKKSRKILTKFLQNV